MSRAYGFTLSGSRLPLAAAAAAAFVALAVALPACQQGRQGDRCNPNLVQSGGATPQYNEDECNTGLSCQVPPTCAVAVCCPSKPPYSDPSCACLANPAAGCACTVSGGVAAWLAAQDAGEDSGGGSVDAGIDSAPATDAATTSTDAAGE